MTCATCHGKKTYRAWRTTFTFPAGRPNHEMTAQDDGMVDMPCPDCTRRPFAVVETGPTGPHVRLGESGMIVGAGDAESAELVAREVNHRVEAREAKLREPLRRLVAAAERFGPVPGAPSHRDHVEVGEAVADARAALAGDGPRYVEEHEHALLMNAFRDLRVTVDALTENDPGARATLAPFLEAMGLRRQTDDELIEEIRRRGYMSVNIRKQPKPSEARDADSRG